MNPLKALRKERGLTQQEIADQFAISRVNYNRYETGARVPPVDMLEKFADYYGVSVDYLLGRTDIPNIYKSQLDDKYELEVWSSKKLSQQEQEQILTQAEEMKNSGVGITVPPGLDQKSLEDFVRQVVDQMLAERERKKPEQ